MSASEEDRTPLDEALDLFVFAPIGLAATAIEELPRIVERGRELVGDHIGTARVIGRVAVNQGRVEMSRLVATWNNLGSVMRSGAMTPKRDATHDAGPAPLHDARVAAKPDRTKRHPAAPANLGIPGYESLSASQVVTRLDGLTPEQLDAVKAYESSTRGRRTILGRISQIQSGPAT